MKLLKPLVQLSVAAMFVGSSAMAQDAPSPPKPTAEHKILAEDAGTWDATIKSYMGGPGAEPTVSKGSEVNEVALGGLWVISKFKGEFAGMKFEGQGQSGYDPIQKKFIGTWIDSMSPTVMLLEGTYDAKTKTMTYKGTGVEPNSGTKYSQRMVTTTKDDGTRVFTLYMKFDGADEEVKSMEVTYTKRK